MKTLFSYFFLIIISTQSFAKNTESLNCENFFIEDVNKNISRNQRYSIIARNQKHVNLQLSDIEMLNDIKNLVSPELINPYNIKMRIINNPNITVVAIPDGEIIINESFWINLTDDEKYFTIAHEIGHIIMQHSCKYYMHVHTTHMKNSTKREKSTMNIDNYLFTHATIYKRLAEFEEMQEIAADNFAFDILKKINLRINHLNMLVLHEDTPENRKNNILLKLEQYKKI